MSDNDGIAVRLRLVDGGLSLSAGCGGRWVLLTVIRELIGEWWRVLARVGSLAPLYGDAGEIAGLGERYLVGEVNAAHYAPWARE
jgi:hypothetical protein